MTAPPVGGERPDSKSAFVAFGWPPDYDGLDLFIQEDRMPIARLSHIGFNVPRDLFDQECDFWENVIGLTKTHSVEGRNAFYSADPLRDHEFILFAVDGPVTGYG